MDHEQKTFSTNGVECPSCKKLMKPDDSHFYNESGVEMECYHCNASLSVDPYVSWSWTTTLSQDKPWPQT